MRESPDSYREVIMPESASVVETEISYCPEMGVYHYKRGEEDYMFTTTQLVESLASHVKSGNQKYADFMAFMTGIARQYPHKLIVFAPDGACSIKELPPVENFAETVSQDEGG